jgi:DNA replication protein DnaC
MRAIADILATMPRPDNADDVYRPPVVPVCPVCKGAGWLRHDVPLGHRLFGQLYKCECIKREEARHRVGEMRQLSQLDGLEAKTFDTFEADTPEHQRALATARSFAESLDSWLVFSGSCGTGKTHLAAAIANATLLNGNQTVMFTVVPDLLDHLRATFDPSRGVDYDERFNTIRTTFLLVLDDLGTENTTPWAREKLYQIVNHRYNDRLPTIITTNQIDHGIDERIVSRMLDRGLSRHIPLNGEDYRRRGDPTYTRARRRRVG